VSTTVSCAPQRDGERGRDRYRETERDPEPETETKTETKTETEIERERERESLSYAQIAPLGPVLFGRASLPETGTRPAIVVNPARPARRSWWQIENMVTDRETERKRARDGALRQPCAAQLAAPAGLLRVRHAALGVNDMYISFAILHTKQISAHFHTCERKLNRARGGGPPVRAGFYFSHTPTIGLVQSGHSPPPDPGSAAYDTTPPLAPSDPVLEKIQKLLRNQVK
jgi:hypothetical protein